MSKCECQVCKMRRTTSSQYEVAIGATPVLLVPYSRDRVYLRAGISYDKGFWVNYGTPGGSLSGMYSFTNFDPFELSLFKEGALVFGPFFASTSLGAQTVVVWETILAPWPHGG